LEKRTRGDSIIMRRRFWTAHDKNEIQLVRYIGLKSTKTTIVRFGVVKFLDMWNVNKMCQMMI